MSLRLFVAVLALAGAALAQDANAELERLRRQLQNQRAEAERLLELRIRHDLGMPIVADVLEGAGRVAATSDAMAKAKRELAEQEAVTANLHQRYRQLSASVAQLQRDAAQATAENLSGASVQIDVPSVGGLVPRVTAPTSQSPAPGGEVAPPRVLAPVPLAEIATELDPVAAQIHGSEDHLRVAQTLLRAAQQLVDRGFELRKAEQAEVAAQLDARAKDRLQRAVAELEPLLTGEAPPYAALFCKGRCLELLFRIDERHAGLSLQRSAKEFQTREAEVRAPFLEISARDVEANPTPGGQPRMGRWGIAAQTALEHFRWMNVRGNWQPKISLDSLQWGKQKP
jgi:hypothetical protein